MLVVFLACCVIGSVLGGAVVRSMRRRADVLERCERSTARLQARFARG